MGLYKPRSFLKLVLLGFAFVAGPLIAELLNTAAHVSRLSTASQTALYQAVQTTQNSWRLFDETLSLERSAAQYMVLGDSGTLENYAVTRQRFRSTLHRLEVLPLTPVQRTQLEMLDRRERAAFLKLRLMRRPAAQQQALHAFNGLAALARGILSDSRDLVNRDAARVRRSAMTARRLLLLQALALIPATLVFTALFAALIARPIGQINQAIRRLGEGEFSRPIVVQGPRDLEYLGAQLDWLRNRLAELDSEKRRFLHEVSHELKTPLCAVREGTELLLAGTLGALRGEQRDVAHILHRNCLRLQTLIENLLHVGRQSSDPGSGEHVPVALHEILAKVASDHDLSLRKKRLQLRTRVAPVYLAGDPRKLAGLIDNLLSNAVKYTDDQGHIEVVLARHAGEAWLDFVDDGPGIAPEERSRVFDAFYRGHDARSSGIRGSGLGLAIARQHAAWHGGHIELLPRTTGTHIRVVLPGPLEALQRAS
ncbi:MAG TPA: HAMP domain-containing sensor histidine kinase [Acidiferrobacteraceae bacterium]|nr:HAMP domain-containing sensor histidine kinase [Acidiferrobacteraceae bacterium]